MKVLVLNSGSSSLKYQLIETSDQDVLAVGLFEKIGNDMGIYSHKPKGGSKTKKELQLKDHEQAIKLLLDTLVSDDLGVIQSIEEIDAVGHRIVSGGDKYASSQVVTDEVVDVIRECIALAPLHNPAHLMGIEAMRVVLPNIPNVVVFDTAFHQTMPEHAYMYALPYEYYEKHKVRRYGAHGTSHKYVMIEAAKALNKPVDDINLITCHLGNGASLTAIKNGKSIDTSMGLTPLEGLVMGTRCGDMDPSIVTFLQDKENLSYKEMNTIMNKKSGIFGLSGISNDMRDIEEAAEKGDHRAKMALNVYAYRIKKYIGAYIAVIGGIDAIVFTAGIGEHGSITREDICTGLEFMGIKLDVAKNAVTKEGEISLPDSPVKVLVIPTNEELMIAMDTARLVK